MRMFPEPVVMPTPVVVHGPRTMFRCPVVVS
ncbi:MAG: hypothetical protein KatS3mg099_451 [Candidatus Parcubacteria bacterium]|nr:MAG: hypothetical protein KatS3mg099_451 [Candidatus Parcubacteria bacterium]